MRVAPENICQFDLKVSDMKRSLTFYAEVFGWRESPCEIYNFHILEVPDMCGFGIALIEDAQLSFSISALRLSFRVKTQNEVELILAAAEKFGGKRLGERHPPGYGKLWEFCDPDGQRYQLHLPSH